jgi:MFS family permease|eukprot:COSAG01_NODE_9190_length_2526_cov_5.652246_3_plen_131_part_00
MCWGGIPRRWGIFTALALHVPGVDGNANLCVKTEATAAAVTSGMGRGQFAGYYGSMRALTVAIGPFVFGHLYAFGRRAFQTRAGHARVNLGFWAAALLGCVVPEIFHRRLLAAKKGNTQNSEAVDSIAAD